MLENLYGDIVSNIGTGLVGGLGLVPGVNLGDSCSVFESVHGSAPSIAGKNEANPTAIILSSVLMLHSLNEHETASKIAEAVEKVYKSQKVLTKDVGGKATTLEFADAILEHLVT